MPIRSISSKTDSMCTLEIIFSVYLSKTGTSLIRPMMSISGWFLDKLMPSDKPLLILRTTVTINVSMAPLILKFFFPQGLEDLKDSICKLPVIAGFYYQNKRNN